eukprot:maker-scaffold_13-snap-gene-4.4-mRNA-1 protein AED:0.01 eAED:0.01 QI:145/1/1/1/1/1/2/507/344
MTYKPPTVVSKYFPEYFTKIPSLKGKVIAITGTTSGTGFIAARTCYLKGAKVITLNRDSSAKRAEKALEKIRESGKESAEANGEIENITCDLQSFESVRRAAEEIKQKYSDGVDVLCNNAGIMAVEDKATVDGYDVQTQTNHLSHFLLTKLLFESLQKAAKRTGEARIVNHTSGARRKPPNKLDAKYLSKNGGNLGGNGSNALWGGRWKRYQQSKLMNACYTIGLSEKLNALNEKNKNQGKIICACAEPGLAATNLQQTTNQQGGMGGWTAWLLMKFSQSAEDGALGIIKGMVDAEVKNGELWGPPGWTGDARPHPFGPFCTEDAVKMCWEESEKATSDVKFPF